MNNRHIIKVIKAIAVLALLVCTSSPASAVTDKEMEEARTYTAKSYLRFVNNGSGYLDDINVKTMTELNSKLKAKEKENIEAFNAVKTPTDYASWDKKRLVEYWAATFFTSPGLDPNGKAARSRVRKYIEGMTITADAPKQEETPAATPTETPATPEESAVAEDGQIAPADVTPGEETDILADQKEIEKAAEESRDTTPREQNRTWVYVLVLAILVGIVIWLVIYAANLMKRQPDPDERDRRKGGSGDANAESELREQTRKAIAAKNQELQQLQERLEASESRADKLAAELERVKTDRGRLEEELRSLREETSRAAKPSSIPAATTKITPPVQNEKQGILKTIYLGRVNRRGIFVRADRRITDGNTIFRLDTEDGMVGTFHVVDEPEVVDLALSDPTEYLSQGCTGEDFEDTAGVTRIVTKSAGTAIFENGYWKVLRKTRIQYE